MSISKNLIEFLGEKDFTIAFWSNILSSLVVTGLIYLLIKLFTNILNERISVLVHEASFIGSNDPMYFVKVTNLSPNEIFTITHVYINDSEKEIDLLDKPLPHKINPSEQWETSFPKSKIKDNKNIFRNIRVDLSNGKIYKSTKNLKIREVGYIA